MSVRGGKKTPASSGGMTTEQRAGLEEMRADQHEPQTPEAIRAEIAELRADLGDTVEALAHRADVKGQVQAKVQEGKTQLRLGASRGRVIARTQLERSRTALDRARPWPQLGALAVGVATLVVLTGRMVSRRRASSRPAGSPRPARNPMMSQIPMMSGGTQRSTRISPMAWGGQMVQAGRQEFRRSTAQ